MPGSVDRPACRSVPEKRLTEAASLPGKAPAATLARYRVHGFWVEASSRR